VQGISPLHLAKQKQKRKEMKKNYFDPEMKVIELKISSAILVGSTGTDSSSSDTELSGGDGGGADKPGFGGDY
jgi:hypothetical protein